MDITAKVDYRSVGKQWSDIKAHVDRLHENGHYSNKNIDLAKSDYNYQGYLNDARKDNDDYFLPYIQFQNFRKASTGHKNEIYKSVNDYFKHRGYSNQRNSIFEIGNSDYRKKYYKILENKGLTTQQIRRIEAKSLVDDVKEYNANSCQSVGAYSVNCDESTAHVHFQNLSYPPADKLGKEVNLMPRGKKWRRKLKNYLIKIGIDPKTANNTIHQKKFYFSKPSASFNNTWKLEFPNAKNKNGQFDSRKALHLANDKYSKMIIRNFNKELVKQTGIKDFKLYLIRTHNVNHQTYKQWLTSKAANSSLKAKANEYSDMRDKNYKNLSNQLYSMAGMALSAEKPKIHHAINTGKSYAETSIASSASSASTSTSNSIASSLNSKNSSFSSSASDWRALISKALSTSASNSAEKIIKDKKEKLASSAQSLSNREDNLNNSYARQLSIAYKPHMPSQPSISDWLQVAKGKIHVRLGKKPISRPLSALASKEASTASSYANATKSSSSYLSSLNSDYRANLSNSASTSASKAINNAGDDFDKMIRDNMINLGVKPREANFDYHHGGHVSNKTGRPDKSMFQVLMDKINDKINKAKNTAKRIINKAKIKAKHFLHINNYGQYYIKDFLYKNKDYYPDEFHKDPNELQGNELNKEFNETAENKYIFEQNQKIRERAKERRRGIPPREV